MCQVRGVFKWAVLNRRSESGWVDIQLYGVDGKRLKQRYLPYHILRYWISTISESYLTPCSLPASEMIQRPQIRILFGFGFAHAPNLRFMVTRTLMLTASYIGAIIFRAESRRVWAANRRPLKRTYRWIRSPLCRLIGRSEHDCLPQL